MKRLWPFPGDSPITKVKKMVLAYRVRAEELERALDMLKRVRLHGMGTRSPLRDEVDDLLDEIEKTDSVAVLDQRFTDWGQTFHCPQAENLEYDDDDLVPTSIAAQLCTLNKGQLNDLRIVGRITATWGKIDGTRGGWFYRVGDLKKLSTEVRTRRARKGSTGDNIPDSDRGVSE